MMKQSIGAVRRHMTPKFGGVPSRSFFTFAQPHMQQSFEKTAQSHAFSKADYQMLKDSPRQYIVDYQHNLKSAHFDANTRTIRLKTNPPFMSHQEQQTHETHHAAQYESMVSRMGGKSVHEDTARDIFSLPQHRTAMEASALLTGKAVLHQQEKVDSFVKSEVRTHLKKYPSVPGYGSLPDAKKVLDAPSKGRTDFHEYSRQRLDSAGVKWPEIT
jgi:hypothetical protein